MWIDSSRKAIPDRYDRHSQITNNKHEFIIVITSVQLFLGKTLHALTFSQHDVHCKSSKKNRHADVFGLVELSTIGSLPWPTAGHEHHHLDALPACPKVWWYNLLIVIWSTSHHSIHWFISERVCMQAKFFFKKKHQSCRCSLELQDKSTSITKQFIQTAVFNRKDTFDTTSTEILHSSKIDTQIMHTGKRIQKK